MRAEFCSWFAALSHRAVVADAASRLPLLGSLRHLPASALPVPNSAVSLPGCLGEIRHKQDLAHAELRDQVETDALNRAAGSLDERAFIGTDRSDLLEPDFSVLVSQDAVSQEQSFAAAHSVAGWQHLDRFGNQSRRCS
jgi:hypothetical protein